MRTLGRGCRARVLALTPGGAGRRQAPGVTVAQMEGSVRRGRWRWMGRAASGMRVESAGGGARRASAAARWAGGWAEERRGAGGRESHKRG